MPFICLILLGAFYVHADVAGALSIVVDDPRVAGWVRSAKPQVEPQKLALRVPICQSKNSHGQFFHLKTKGNQTRCAFHDLDHADLGNFLKWSITRALYAEIAQSKADVVKRIGDFDDMVIVDIESRRAESERTVSGKIRLSSRPVLPEGFIAFELWEESDDGIFTLNKRVSGVVNGDFNIAESVNTFEVSGVLAVGNRLHLIVRLGKDEVANRIRSPLSIAEIRIYDVKLDL